MTRPNDSAIWGPGVAPAPVTEDDLLRDHLARAAADGRAGTYVVFPYCISIVVMSFKRSSGIKFVPDGSSRVLAGLPYLIISLLFGWWGIPWGIAWTLQSIGVCLDGGRDLSPVLDSLRAREVIQALTDQAALEAKHKVDARVLEDPGFVDAGLAALVLGKFGGFIGNVNTSAVEALPLPTDKLAGLVELMARTYYESYAIGLMKAPHAAERLEELKAAKNAADAQWSDTRDDNERWALAVETWRRVPEVRAS